MCLFLNSTETFETKKTDDCSNNTKRRKEDSYRCKPPINHLLAAIEKFPPQFVETVFHFDISEGDRASIWCMCQLLLFRFVVSWLDVGAA